MYFVECGTAFTNLFGDIDGQFYNVVCRVFHDVVEIVSQDKKLFEWWNSRLIAVVRESDGIGWGFHEYLSEEYYSIPWVEE